MSEHEPLTPEEYAAMGYDELHRELKKMIARAQRMTRWFNVDKQLRLLPALMAMKSLVAQPGRRFVVVGQPNWEEECKLLGLTVERVRQWKHRTASETDIRWLVGDEKEWNRPYTSSKELLRLKMLTEAVLNGDDEEAEKLAQWFAEEYGF